MVTMVATVAVVVEVVRLSGRLEAFNDQCSARLGNSDARRRGFKKRIKSFNPVLTRVWRSVATTSLYRRRFMVVIVAILLLKLLLLI